MVRPAQGLRGLTLSTCVISRIVKNGYENDTTIAHSLADRGMQLTYTIQIIIISLYVGTFEKSLLEIFIQRDRKIERKCKLSEREREREREKSERV